VSVRSIALAALDEEFHDQIKLRFAAIFLNGKVSLETLQHFQSGLHELCETHLQAIAIVIKELNEG
jgi:hypothetical protein